jgi:NADPH:quinone reductase-like Zn-dependent oxidoreductase
MKAAYLDKKAGAESLVIGELLRPAPAIGEVLVKVHATAITPTELQWYPTFNTSSGESRPFPIVLSHEFSGVIEELGSGVKDMKVGDEVYGLNGWFSNGAQAEYCVAPTTMLTAKPRSLDHIQSAVVPISALTAWQGLFEKTGLQRGQRILIHGAAGGVGIFVVQLARWRGAHVIATASADNLDFVRTLGANEMIDYKTVRFEDVARNIDVVFDCVGGETLKRSWQVLTRSGRLVTIAAQSEGVTEQRIRDAFMLVRADGTQLKQIANLIDSGELRVFVEEAFPLSEVREAFARADHGKMRGKVALKIRC